MQSHIDQRGQRKSDIIIIITILIIFVDLFAIDLQSHIDQQGQRKSDISSPGTNPLIDFESAVLTNKKRMGINVTLTFDLEIFLKTEILNKQCTNVWSESVERRLVKSDHKIFVTDGRKDALNDTRVTISSAHVGRGM